MILPAAVLLEVTNLKFHGLGNNHPTVKLDLNSEMKNHIIEWYAVIILQVAKNAELTVKARFRFHVFSGILTDAKYLICELFLIKQTRENTFARINGLNTNNKLQTQEISQHDAILSLFTRLKVSFLDI